MFLKIKKCIISKMPDSLYLRYQYFKHFGRWLNLKNPKRFTEKIQWLKLNNRNPLYTRLVDKYSVREYVANKIGDQYLIPLIGVWDNPNQIDFDTLPNKFVLKTTHDSGGVFVCKDKTQINPVALRDWLNKRMQLRVFPVTREWPYKNVKPRIICERFLSDGLNEDLTDYKWYCFNGEPKYCQVIRNRSTDESIDFFDMGWKHQDFIGLTLNTHFSPVAIPQPHNLDNMIRIARNLSMGIPFVRVDLYEVNAKEYFGELTFFPASGFGRFRPEEWDFMIGQFIDIYDIPSCKSLAQNANAANIKK